MELLCFNVLNMSFRKLKLSVSFFFFFMSFFVHLFPSIQKIIMNVSTRAGTNCCKKTQIIEKVIIEYSFIVFCIYYRIYTRLHTRSICYSFCAIDVYVCFTTKLWKWIYIIWTPSQTPYATSFCWRAYGYEVIYSLWNRKSYTPACIASCIFCIISLLFGICVVFFTQRMNIYCGYSYLAQRSSLSALF